MREDWGDGDSGGISSSSISFEVAFYELIRQYLNNFELFNIIIMILKMYRYQCSKSTTSTS